MHALLFRIILRKIFKMKTIYLLLISTVMFVSCSKDDSTLDDIKLTSGYWVVTKSTKDGKDQTSAFADYKFVFADGGVVTATRGGNTVKGNWSRITDSGKIKFILDFSSPDFFREISEDWLVIKETPEVLELADTENGTLQGKDVLNFKAGN